MEILKRVKEWFTGEEEVSTEIPKEWVKDKQVKKKRKRGRPRKLKAESKTVRVKHTRQRRKFRIPGLRLFKRFLAGILAIFYFILSQITLTGNPQTQGFAILFLLTCVLMVDYLWKTRREKEIFEKVMKHA